MSTPNKTDRPLQGARKSSAGQTCDSSSQQGSKRNRVIFGGVGLGVALFLVLLCCIQVVLPVQSAVDPEKDYGYVYSGAKSESLDFVRAASTDETVLLFGSSELSTPSSTIPQVPAEVFGMNDYGLDLMYIGEAYDQSLWQAIAAGAYGPQVTNKKVVLIVSPTWFEDDGLDAETFKLRFSYELYRAFCENDAISDSSKAYVAKRLEEQGIDPTTVEAAGRTSAVTILNDAILAAISDLQIRSELDDVRARAFDRAEGQFAPLDFSALYEQALADAQAMCTNNDWGMDDAFYAGNIEGRLDRLKGAQANETFSNQAEFQDFSFFLKVCKEAGLEPLVIVSPVHGEFYDWVGTSATDRARCYERIRDICAAHNVPCEDFSDKEYEQYFLHDIVHFGWTGWVAVEEAIYDYVQDQG